MGLIKFESRLTLNLATWPKNVAPCNLISPGASYELAGRFLPIILKITRSI